MENINDYKEIIDIIKEKGGDSFKLCYQCGKCDVVCPWNKVRDFSMRKLVRGATFGMSEIEGEDIWLCTTCGKCTQECPRDVKQVESGIALRRMATDYGIYTASADPIRSIRSALAADGNPFFEERSKRGDWAQGHSVKTFTKDMEILYYPGCYLSFDPRLKKVAAATSKILNKAGVNFGILGSKENCCGESIRKAGDEELYVQLAKENIKTFIDHGVKKILVSSPHCYNTFKKEYPEFMVHFEVIHIAQYLFELIDEGRLELNKEYNKKVTYHDPCYLGRHNGIYDEPRNVLQKISGVELAEMTDSKEDSLCCGGGGGRIWMDTPKGERFSDLRIDQAVETGAEVLVTSCPYCIVNFEDSILSSKHNESIEIKDITEIIQEAIS
ncbi:MAG: (Fe-S)-binding protein [Bacteroidetes bacterium]|nr:(Fe-S)-binding protein [Bacteroidota bacterium]MBL6963628.1 (Fe-S)-binding protein [Bacteroidota bacterium]